MWYEPLLEKGLLPDPVVRIGIRQQLRARLRDQGDPHGSADRTDFWESLASGPIATHTDAANAQHYEVPSAFYGLVLGPHRKYSSGLWPAGTDSLEAAELAMLGCYVDRARLVDGQRMLDLGCGWGSLSLFLAQRFPGSEVVAVSNSSGQRDFIEASAAQRGLANLRVIRADVNDFDPPGTFDRVLSIEMFEHMSNYRLLLERIAGWLRDDGLLFVHHFAHRDNAYPFLAGADNEWMATHFFSGGIMPSADLLDRFDESLGVVRRWHVSGVHYQRTCEAWLGRMADNRERILELFADTYGSGEAGKHFHTWRVFFLACAELFGYRRGSEWFVVHSLLSPDRRRGAAPATEVT